MVYGRSGAFGGKAEEKAQDGQVVFHEQQGLKCVLVSIFKRIREQIIFANKSAFLKTKGLTM